MRLREALCTAIERLCPQFITIEIHTAWIVARTAETVSAQVMRNVAYE